MDRINYDKALEMLRVPTKMRKRNHSDLEWIGLAQVYATLAVADVQREHYELARLLAER